MNYRMINNHIADRLSLSETYSYLILALKSDYETLVSNINQETLAAMVGVNRSTIQDHITKMAENEIIYKSLHLGYINNHGSKKCQYKLIYDISPKYGTPEHWVWIDIGLLDKEPISKELKAFLVKLKIMCFNNTNECHYSIRKLEEAGIGIKRSSIDKYLKQAEALGYITRKKGIITL